MSRRRTAKPANEASNVIALPQATNVPFDSLVLSQRNVRNIQNGVSIEQLAADIKRRGLLQSLNVRMVPNEDGSPSGVYEVPAGGRRYRALQLLVSAGELDQKSLIPVVVKVGGSAADDSFAENAMRVPLHPLDQFRAFKTLRDEGQSVEDIAATHFVTAEIVKQRLRLAGVAPDILDMYQAGEIQLDQVMAFALAEDQDRQLQVWETIRNLGHFDRTPPQIRRRLIEKSIKASDKRVRFVTLDAYEAAGGRVDRDLFSTEDEAWCVDVVLLNGLVQAKLTEVSDTLKAKGWAWVEAATDFPFDATYGLRQLVAGGRDELEQERLMALNAERDELLAEVDADEDLGPEADAYLAELEEEIQALEDKGGSYLPDEMVMAGCFVSITREGELNLRQGFVRPEDEIQEEEPEAAISDGADDVGADCRTFDNAAAVPAGDPEEMENVERPLSSTLVSELGATRTIGMRNAFAQHPDVAFNVMLAQLVVRRYVRRSKDMLDVRVGDGYLPVTAPGMQDLDSALAIEERDQHWRSQVQTDDVLAWVEGLEMDAKFALLAHLLSYGITVAARRDAAAPADPIAERIAFDMSSEWRPTRANYLERVTKGHIQSAVREACGADMAGRIEHMKKGPMAAEAERLLAHTGWVPLALRLGPDAVEIETASEDEEDALPAFLSGDADGADDAEAAPVEGLPPAIAAE